MNKTCELCGASVEVIGSTTKSYKNLDKERNEKLEGLKKEYAEQDNRGTAYPIFVTVQELRPIGVANDDYCYGENSEIRREEIEDSNERVNVLYIWTDVEFFLTAKGASEYIRANKHNLGEARTYVKHFNHRNFEMRELLETLGFKLDDAPLLY